MYYGNNVIFGQTLYNFKPFYAANLLFSKRLNIEKFVKSSRCCYAHFRLAH